MWLQFLDLPGLRRVMSSRLTYLSFPDPAWGTLPDDERAGQLAAWLRRTRDERFADELDTMLREAIVRAAEDYHLWARGEQLGLQTMRRTRTWRMRERLVRIDPLRTLLARRR
jgi:hypothetical protein